LPKHGLEAATLARIDDLEEEIAALDAQLEQTT